MRYCDSYSEQSTLSVTSRVKEQKQCSERAPSHFASIAITGYSHLNVKTKINFLIKTNDYNKDYLCWCLYVRNNSQWHTIQIICLKVFECNRVYSVYLPTATHMKQQNLTKRESKLSFLAHKIGNISATCFSRSCEEIEHR